jgi:hypothetical protein
VVAKLQEAVDGAVAEKKDEGLSSLAFFYEYFKT